MKLRIFLAVALFMDNAFLCAVAPVITSGPVTWYTQKYGLGVKYTTSDGAGATSTLQNNLAATSCCISNTVNVAAGTGANFPLGSIIRIGLEHLQITTQAGDVLTATRGYSFNGLSVVSGNLINIVVTGGNSCTANYTMAHQYPVGSGITVANASGAFFAGQPWTISSVTTNSATWTCTGSTNGTYSNPGLTTQLAPLAHSIGDTITRVDVDAWVQYGPTAAYGTCVAAPPGGTNFPQDMNHWLYIFAQTPGSTVHWRVLSTPKGLGPTNCVTPGPDTVFSADQITVLPTTPVSTDPTAAADPRWNPTDALTYTTDNSQSTCVNMQTELDNMRGANGNNNYRLKIPAAVFIACHLTAGVKNGANTSGTGKLVIDTADYASLPSLGVQVDPSNSAAWLNHMPTLYTSNTTPVITVAPGAASYWIIRGLQITVDPTLSTADFGSDFYLINTFAGDYTDQDPASAPNHLAFLQNRVYCPTYNNHCAGMRWHGQYLSAIDNYFGPLFGISNDRGGIQTDGISTQFTYVYHNYIEATFSGYYQSDNGFNPQDTWVMRNTIVKRRRWNQKDAEFGLATTQAVSGLTLGTSTTITTTNHNDFQTNHPIAFTGGTGSYAVMNYQSWSVSGAFADNNTPTTGTLQITCTSGTCQAVTSAPHLLSTGDRGYIGGGHLGACTSFNTGIGAPVTFTVINATTVSFTYPGGDFSNVSGTGCKASNPTIIAPVYVPTVLNSTQATIPLNSTGFTGTAPTAVWYAQPQGFNVKNAFEFKTGVRARVEGNIIIGSWAFNQSGQLISMTVRGPDSFYGWQPAQGPNQYFAGLTISDVDITNNLFKDGCTSLAIIGANPNSPTTPMLRVRDQNNVFMNVSATATAGGTCTQSVSQNSQSYELTMNHSTYQNLNRVINEDGGKSPLLISTNNIYNASNVEYNLTCIGAGLISGQGCAAYTYANATWSRNARYGCKWCAGDLGGSVNPWGFTQGYLDGDSGSGSVGFFQNFYYPPSQQDVGFVGNMPITAASGTAPVTLTVSGNTCQPGDYVMIDGSTGKTAINGLWPVGVGSTSTQLVIAGAVDTGFYTGGGSVQPFGGSCATLASIGLSASSNYLTGSPYVVPSYPPSTAGTGPGLDGLTLGANINQIQSAINGTVTASTVLTNVGVRNVVIH